MEALDKVKLSLALSIMIASEMLVISIVIESFIFAMANFLMLMLLINMYVMNRDKPATAKRRRK